MNNKENISNKYRLVYKIPRYIGKRYTAMLRKALKNILSDCKGGKSHEHLGLKDKFFDSIEENALDAIFALDTLLKLSKNEEE